MYLPAPLGPSTPLHGPGRVSLSPPDPATATYWPLAPGPGVAEGPGDAQGPGVAEGPGEYEGPEVAEGPCDGGSLLLCLGP